MSVNGVVPLTKNTTLGIIIMIVTMTIQVRNVGRQTGTYRTFPVPRNIPRNVPLFLVSSVFPYSKGEEGR